MLLLTRKRGQQIFIGDDIKIRVVRISEYQVTIGIDAPDDISIHREEIYAAIQKEQLVAENTAT